MIIKKKSIQLTFTHHIKHAFQTNQISPKAFYLYKKEKEKKKDEVKTERTNDFIRTFLNTFARVRKAARQGSVQASHYIKVGAIYKISISLIAQ